MNRWQNSWTLLDNPVHLDDMMRSPDGTDFNGESKYRSIDNRLFIASDKTLQILARKANV